MKSLHKMQKGEGKVFLIGCLKGLVINSIYFLFSYGLMTIALHSKEAALQTTPWLFASFLLVQVVISRGSLDKLRFQLNEKVVQLDQT